MTDASHDWDSAYRRADAPPWDIGRPQPVFASLAEGGLMTGQLLDAGCGTGEHTLLAAAHGADALGVDVSPSAIETARAKATARGIAARFEVGDLLELSAPPASFDTVLDSGVFHSFDDDERARYVDVLARVTRPGGHCYLVCFSEHQPGDWGPRRVTQAELRAAFADGWTVESIEAATFDINPLPDVPFVRAWFAVLRRNN